MNRVMDLVAALAAPSEIFAGTKAPRAPVSDLPASIPYGYGVDADVLRQIEFSESANFEQRPRA